MSEIYLTSAHVCSRGTGFTDFESLDAVYKTFKKGAEQIFTAPGKLVVITKNDVLIYEEK